MENSLYDTESMRRFADAAVDKAANGSTILNFPHFLEARRLAEKLFQTTARYLSGQDVIKAS